MPTGRFLPAFACILMSSLLISLLTGLPGNPGDLFTGLHLGLSPELALLLAASAPLAQSGWQPGRRTIALLSLLTLPLLLLRLSDLVAQLVAGRPMQPLFDPALLPALWDVLATGIGVLPLTLLACLLPGLLLGLLFLAYGALLRPLARREGRVAALLLAALALIGSFTGLPGVQPWEQGAIAALRDQGRRIADGRQMQRDLAASLANDPLATIAPDRLLSALRGRSVVLVWVESYGRSALTDPRHASRTRDRLTILERDLSAHGFHSLSGLVESPVIGGRSWLAHGTLRAGIRQVQPEQQGLVLASGRAGLVLAFRQAGWRTMAAMPGLSGPWPEGRLWGFDEVLDGASLGYAGPAFGWSPMPDQALLAAMTLRRPLAARATFLELVLTSSHAPWTPLPPWLDEVEPDALAGGGAYGPPGAPDYTGMAESYGRSIDYSLRAAGDWLIRSLPDDALVLMLGDHPAVGWIADSAGASHEVPLHILSKDATLLRAVSGWGLAEGMMPAADATPIPMQDLLGKLLSAYSGPRPDGV